MATLTNERKLAAVSKSTEECAGNGQSQNMIFPGMTEEYITQVSEKLEGGSLKNFARQLVGRSHVVWVL